MRPDVEGRIDAIAARQHGVVTRAQLLAAGISPSAVGRLLKAGRLRQLHVGVYLVGPLAPPLAREMAAVLASGPDAWVSHLSAASGWGLRPVGGVSHDGGRGHHVGVTGAVASLEPVDITIESGNRGRRPGVRLHRVTHLAVSDKATLHGVPMTSPERTLIDLAGMVGSRELEAAVARAEREGLVDRETLVSLVERSRGRPGVAALRALVAAPAGPALTRSEAEARFLALVREARLPPPELNVPIGRYEVDFLWRGEGIAVEVDGFRHHSSRPRFEGDRRKDSWLLAAGIKVVRLSWRQIVDDPMATAVQVGQALARADA